MKSFYGNILFIAVLFAAHVLHAQLDGVDLSAIEATTPLSPDELPVIGTYYSAANPTFGPAPGNIYGLWGWILDATNGIYLQDDLPGAPSGGTFAMDDSYPPLPDGYDGTNGGVGESFDNFSLSTSGLWLWITNAANNTLYANLHNGSGYVYEILSTTNLETAASAVANWDIEYEVFPQGTNPMPLNVSINGRNPLYLWARNWAGITNNGNVVPEWWLYYWFQTINISDTNLDGHGNTYLYDYQHGLAPLPPTITAQPQSETVMLGSNASFSVTAEGAPPPGETPMYYQWYWNGSPLSDEGGVSGSGTATLNLTGVNLSQAGYYQVVVSNTFSSVSSTPAFLTVMPVSLYLMPTNAYWNVTDISDPAQPVNIGVLQEPFGAPGYTNQDELVPLFNTLWHADNTALVANAYGTATYGGANGVGTVFETGVAGGTNFTVIHTFNGTSDGAYPCSQLAISGSTFYGIPTTVYGTTFSGGTYNCGTVFKVNTDGTGFANLYQFTGTNDGKYPLTGLLISGKTLYGTTTNSIFKINTDGSDFVCLTNITNASQLLLSLSGETLYGTTPNGGTDNLGMVFSINTDGSDFTDLHDFDGTNNGAFPSAGLTLPVVDNWASIWSLDTTINVSADDVTNASYAIAIDNCYILYVNGNLIFYTNSTGDAVWMPYSSLPLQAGENDIRIIIGGDDDGKDYFAMAATSLTPVVLYDVLGYGTTSAGGAGDGTVFALTPDGSELPLHTFSGSDGDGPIGDLVLSGNTLYGVTQTGGTNNLGTIFSVYTNGSGFTSLYSFTGLSDGAHPEAGLILTNGTLYGTAYDGADYGTIFSICTNGIGFTPLHTFTGYGDGGNNISRRHQ